MVEYVTNTQFNLSVTSIEESIDVITSQMVVLRNEMQGVSPTVELNAFKANFDEQIDNINIQIQQLRRLRDTPTDVDQKLTAIISLFNEKVENLLKQFGILRDTFNSFEGDYKGATGFIVYRAQIDEQIDTINKQLQMLRQQQSTTNVDQQLVAIQATFDEKIKAINLQLAQLRQNLEQAADHDHTAIMALVEEQAKAAATQIQVLTNELEILKAQQIDIPASITQQVDNLIAINNQLLVEIKRIEETVPVSTVTITIPVSSSGDEWSGTKSALGVEPDTVLKWNVMEKNVVTRTPGEGTYYKFKVKEKRNNEFDWSLGAYALVLSGTLEVQLEYGKGML